MENQEKIDDEAICGTLGWTAQQFRQALENLSAQGLIELPDGKIPPPLPEPPQRAEDRRAEYTRADIARAQEGEEGKEFKALADAVEQKLGKKMTTPDLQILLGLYDQLGLPTDVIYLLVSFCAERVVKQYGEGRRPTLRQIEKEGYIWARQGLMTQESAAAYIRKYHQSQEALPRMMALLGLGDRKPSPSEEKCLMKWIGMGFEDQAVLQAYDKTVLKCKELKWPYMDRILSSWHEKGLHTLEQIEAGDRPVRQQARPEKPAMDTAQEDIARMKRYHQRLRQEMEES